VLHVRAGDAGLTRPRLVSRAALLTAAAMAAFAANSILCRLALARDAIDPAMFTAVRLVSGAAMLAALASLSKRNTVSPRSSGTWASALALFTYAAAFSFAYVRLPAGIGALVLFGMVQLTMVGWGWARGERLTRLQAIGFGLAALGLGALTLPGATSPDPLALALMGAAGVAWGVYSLRGRGATDPLQATAGNFVRTVPLAAALVLFVSQSMAASREGLLLAVASGAVASALGYVIWYAALRDLSSTQAALVQLSVPVLAAAGGIAFLGEALTARLAGAGATILVGIGLGQRPRTEADIRRL
jgi:drug/metabolite transporter (DMT)-like permease